MDTWIDGAVKARCVRCLVACAFVLVAVAVLAAGHVRYVQNFLMGPYAVSAAHLDAIRDVSQAGHYFVRVDGTQAIDTGIEEIATRKGGESRVSANFFAVPVGRRFLVCRSESGFKGTFEGELKRIPPDLAAQLAAPLATPVARDRFYPFYVDGNWFRYRGYLAVTGFLVVLLFLGKRAVPAWKHLQDPASHPLIKRVQGWGDPVGEASAAQREMATPRFLARNGWCITDNFVVRSTFLELDLFRFTDVLWAYKSVTKRTLNGILTGTTYAAVLVCKSGIATVKCTDAGANEILRFAAQRAPKAIFGYSKELETRFMPSKTRLGILRKR